MKAPYIREWWKYDFGYCCVCQKKFKSDDTNHYASCHNCYLEHIMVSNAKYVITIGRTSTDYICGWKQICYGNQEGGNVGLMSIEEIKERTKQTMARWITRPQPTKFREMTESNLFFASSHEEITKDWILRCWKSLRLTHQPPKYYYDDHGKKLENKVQSNGLGKWFK